jgi:hypothetical protein
MALLLRAGLGVAALGLAPALAFAQAAGPQPTPPPADTGAAPPAAAPAGSAPAVVPATGYGWSTTPQKHGGRRRVGAVHPKAGPPAGTIIPGFETLADGSSRVFVQLPHQVTYAAKPSKGGLVYVLKGLHIDRRNNLNALVTVHFNTPVTTARLVPHGADLWLVMDLRSAVQPTVAMDATKDGGAMLRVEFPKGDYIGGTAIVPMQAAPGAAPAAPATAQPPPASSAAPAPASPAPNPSDL